MNALFDQSLTSQAPVCDISSANLNPYDQAIECLRELSNQNQVGQLAQIHLFELPDGVNVVVTVQAVKTVLTFSYQLTERSTEQKIQRVLDEALNLTLYQRTNQQEAA
ncbi:hypothetical protein ORI99_00695 [Alishewanella sp. SMS9]|nr:hypothetical protein [Alishewanella sp. SMS9]